MTGLALVYAICYAAIKAGLVYAPALRFASLRAFLAGGALLTLLVILRRPALPTRASWRWVLALGLTTTTLAFAGMFLSPGRTGAGIASVLGNTQPIMALALAAAILHERLDRSKLFALGLGTLGVVLIAYPELSGPSGYGISGAALALGTSAALAVGSIIAKRMGDKVDLINMTAWQLIVGAIPLLALSVLFEPGAIVWDPRFIALLALLGLVGTALPTPIWYWLLRGDEVGRLSLLLYLVPAAGLLIGTLVFGEPLSRLEIGGMVLVVLAGLVAGVGAADAKSSVPPSGPATLAVTVTSTLADAGQRP
ncbi:MAG: DMT family transporter [Candidatus Dormibacteraceae bacterium]